MNISMALQILGYIASGILVVSLTMTNIFRLRVWNIVGSVIFSIYAILLQAWPVLIFNLFCIALNLVYLARSLRTSDYFALRPAQSLGEEFLDRFFLFHQDDILRYAPHTTLELLTQNDTRILFRNMLPIGLFVFRQQGKQAKILVDYVVPAYRDFKSGRFLFKDQSPYFRERGIQRFYTRVAQPQTARYLRKHGFYPSPDEPEVFIRDL